MKRAFVDAAVFSDRRYDENANVLFYKLSELLKITVSTLNKDTERSCINIKINPLSKTCYKT